MQANRPRNTSNEVALRSALHRNGLRFFKHRRVVKGLRCEPDVVFPRIRLAVFVDGCFWHRCPQHGSMPKKNGDWWRTKLEGNEARDRRNREALEANGWTVLRVWEHEPVSEAAIQISAMVRALRGEGTAT